MSDNSKHLCSSRHIFKTDCERVLLSVRNTGEYIEIVENENM